MATRLWDKGDSVNERVHRFTVGSDPQIDLELVRFDVFGSAAHAKMLAAVGLISGGDLKAILGGLTQIRELAVSGKFDIPTELEDCHTAIEGFLTAQLGESGKKVHTGRSRNDQILVTVRLYLREQILEVMGGLRSLLKCLCAREQGIGSVPMPGYTHFQRAMPSTVGMWLGAYAEGALELLSEGRRLLEGLDSNPLGVGAGFGVSLDLDRTLTAKLLGFSRVQRNPIDVQNSRGRYELRALRWYAEAASLLEKLAWDMLLFSTDEFGFFSLPGELLTGSSIMPQKHNPDVLELLRASAAKIRGAESELSWIIAKLPSSYHRDYQFTKEPLVRASACIREMLDVAGVVIEKFAVDEKKLAAALSPEIYATYEAYRQVKDGAAFRTAYREAAELCRSGKLDVESLKKDAKKIEAEVTKSFAELQRDLAGFDVWTAAERARLEKLEQEALKF